MDIYSPVRHEFPLVSAVESIMLDLQRLDPNERLRRLKTLGDRMKLLLKTAYGTR